MSDPVIRFMRLKTNVPPALRISPDILEVLFLPGQVSGCHPAHSRVFRFRKPGRFRRRMTKHFPRKQVSVPGNAVHRCRKREQDHSPHQQESANPGKEDL